MPWKILSYEFTITIIAIAEGDSFGWNAPCFKYPLDYGIHLPIPEHCELKQVQLLARHGERYPSKSKGAKLSNVYKKLQNYTGALNGSLSFVNDDNYCVFWEDASKLELEATSKNSLDPLNPYTGEQSARTHARQFIFYMEIY